MFEIEANSQITVTRLEFAFNSYWGNRYYNLYLYSGGSIDTTGFDFPDQNGWETEFQGGMAMTGERNAVTELAVDIDAGDKQAFYIAALNGQSILVRGRDNFGIDAERHSNSDLVIKGGYATSSGDPFATGFGTMYVSPTFITVYYKLTTR